LIYAAFVLWLFLILGMGVGVYRLCSQLVRPTRVNWAILPGTIVSEMAYTFGGLITHVFRNVLTGGELKRDKLIDGGSSRKSRSGSKDKSKSRAFGSVLASLVSIATCAAAIVAAQWLLGRHVMEKFTEVWSRSGKLPEELPMTWPAFWGQLDRLVHLQRSTCEALVRLEWAQWQVTVFVYLSMCLAVRLTPVRGTARQTLAAMLAVAGIVALIAGLAPQAKGLVEQIWPLLTYVWTGLLTLLLMSLLLCGAVTVVRVLAGTSRS
jgi:hypothetical protein